MKTSEKIEGYWEEGYHYYLEFSGERLTVRDYARRVMLETTVSYDADAVGRGERVVISLADNTLSRNLLGESFTRIAELSWEDGSLELVYGDYTPETKLYKLHKVDNGPFSHIIIRDDEVLGRIQGKWAEWSPSGKSSRNTVSIVGNRIFGFGFADGGSEFHAVSYTYDKDRIRLVPASLTNDLFPGWTAFDVKEDGTLTSNMIVMDMSTPLSVFARPDMLDKIEVPEAAKRPAVNTMMYRPQVMEPPMPMTAFFGMAPPTPGRAYPAHCASCGGKIADFDPKKGGFCPSCGHALEHPVGNFCTECGVRLSEAIGKLTPQNPLRVCPLCGEEPDRKPPKHCTACGEKFGDPAPNFCPECGSKT